MINAAKRSLLRAWSTLPVASDAFAPLLRDRATIFMLHRFSDPERGVEGHDPALLARALASLRKRRYEILSLEDIFRRMGGEGAPLQRAVAFTIDDGYYDQATVAAPVFAKYDCPVTTFVTTGFLDGEIWFWWDRIEYVFLTSRRKRLSVALNDSTIDYAWEDELELDAGRRDFIARCKRMSDPEKDVAIGRLAEAAEVEVPERPPTQYAPMSWDQLRSCERETMTFGPHTVTHPILARTDDGQAKHEVLSSWSRLRAEATRPVTVFCYPNGQPGDFGAREINWLRDAGFIGAVVGTPGYAHGARFRAATSARFVVRRFGWPAEFPQALQYASGLERLKEIMRREDA